MLNSISSFSPFNYTKAKNPSRKQDIQFAGAASNAQENTIEETSVLKRKNVDILPALPP